MKDDIKKLTNVLKIIIVLRIFNILLNLLELFR
uniref:Uncharacterized protein n=1 Tax=Firmicutes phage HS08 TaxID=3056391 RepID=A0AA50AEN8_9VIRU|nr:MAG: hypothetical protein [Firmicutes phage HS08]